MGFSVPVRVVACVGDLCVCEFVAVALEEESGFIDTPGL